MTYIMIVNNILTLQWLGYFAYVIITKKKGEDPTDNEATIAIILTGMMLLSWLVYAVGFWYQQLWSTQ